MCEQTNYADRKSLIHLLNSGEKPWGAAQELGRSPAWAYRWKNRYEQDGLNGLRDRSRAPKHILRSTPAEVRQGILHIRGELEVEAENKDNLGYIGADAIYGRLRSAGITPLPAVSTIERLLRQAGKTKPRPLQVEKEVIYPHLKPTAVHQLTQVDIVPHYLTGG
jgi:transposase